MLYPASVVDGLVHQLGGKSLRWECALINFLKGGCPVGSAVVTSWGGLRLMEKYDKIVHTTPPFYRNQLEQIKLLRRCYAASIELSFKLKSSFRVASPLLGAGARGFPEEVAILVASEESVKWMNSTQTATYRNAQELALVFAIPDPSTADKLVRSIALAEDTHRTNSNS